MKSSRAAAWTQVFAFTGVIYATLPVGPRLWRAAVRGLGEWQDVVVVLALLAVFAGIVYVALRHAPRASMRTAVGLGAVIAAYAAILALVSLTPAEKLHFLYYGVLAFLVHRSLSIDVDGGALSGLTVLLVAVIGLGDEGIQHVLPNRFFEWKDVALNGVSGALATAIILLLSPTEPR